MSSRKSSTFSTNSSSKKVDLRAQTEAESIANLRAAILNDYAEMDAVFTAVDQQETLALKQEYVAYEQHLSDPDNPAKLAAYHLRHKESQEAADRLAAAETVIYKVRDKVRARLKVPEHDRPEKITIRNITVCGARRDIMSNAVSDLKCIVNDSVLGSRTIAVDSTLDRRSFYDSGTIFLDANATPRTALHELGHWIEMNSPDTLRRSVAFLDDRTEGMPFRQMRRLTGDQWYRPDEVGQKARPGVPEWLSPYWGKRYPTDYATEILSKGLDLYWHEPATLIKHDPELFDFLYRSLRNLDPLPKRS